MYSARLYSGTYPALTISKTGSHVRTGTLLPLFSKSACLCTTLQPRMVVIGDAPAGFFHRASSERHSPRSLNFVIISAFHIFSSWSVCLHATLSRHCFVKQDMRLNSSCFLPLHYSPSAHGSNKSAPADRFVALIFFATFRARISILNRGVWGVVFPFFFSLKILSFICSKQLTGLMPCDIITVMKIFKGDTRYRQDLSE